MKISVRRIGRPIPAGLVVLGGALVTGIGLFAWWYGEPFHNERILVPLGVAAAGLASGALWSTVADRVPVRSIWFGLIALTGVGGTLGAWWAAARTDDTAWWVAGIPVTAALAALGVWWYDLRLPTPVSRSLTASGTIVTADPSAIDIQHVFEFRDRTGRLHRFPWRPTHPVRSGERCQVTYDPEPPVTILTVKVAKRR